MVEPYKQGPWMVTVTGKQVWFLDPTPDMIDIEDIAVSLSRTPRFRGHTKPRTYAVAQHCCLCTHLVPRGDMLWALLHDAAEAYFGDMIKPIKEHIGGRYKEAENRMLQVIIEKFGLTWPQPESVSIADRIMLVTEAAQITPDHPDDWHLQLGVVPDPNIKVVPWVERVAYNKFMKIFEALTRD